MTMTLHSPSIPKRSLFFQQLQQSLNLCDERNENLGLLIVNVRKFRQINIQMGYHTGDSLLNQLMKRIQGILRDSDELSRIGDNEFAVVLPDIRNHGHAVLAASRILDVVKEPFVVDNRKIKPDVAIGVSLFPLHAQEAEPLTRKADIALTQAKSNNRSVSVFLGDDQPQNPSDMISESELEQALENDEFEIYFQPKVNLDTDSICGVEVLSRWTCSKRGAVSPEVFIPLIENSRLVVPYTIWTINTALRYFDAHRGRCPNSSIAVNLPANILNQIELVELIQRAVNLWSISPEQLILEITESAIMTDLGNSLSALQRLHESGFKLAIDDFGTGYSSLAYLKKLPVTELKIDQSFVKHLNENSDDAVIVQSIIDLAHNFKLSVTAEGVEDEETFDRLKAMNCQCVQGFYVGVPMPAEQFLGWLAASQYQKIAIP